MKIITPRVASFMALSCAMMSNQASAISYDLELNNQAAFTGQTLARVTLTDISGGGVSFNIEALIPGTKLAEFGFNFLSNTAPTGFSITSLPTNWGYSVDIDRQGGFNGYGKFDVDVKDGGSANRLNPLTFSINVGTVADYVALSNKGESSLFSAHVTSLNETGSGSCDGTGACTAITGFAGGGTTAVPVPATIWLFGSGLLGMAALARRKRDI